MIKHVIFSQNDVLATLEGRKTRFSREANVPVGDHNGTDIMDWHLSKHPYEKDGNFYYHIQNDVDSYDIFKLKYPYGHAGDQEWQTGKPTESGVYWVKGYDSPVDVTVEDYACLCRRKGTDIDIVEVSFLGWKRMGTILCVKESYVYRHKHDRYYYKADHPEFAPYAHTGWRSPATMPKEAARIWVEVVGVKVQRLQDITQDDAQREGVVALPHRCGGWENPLHNTRDCFKCAYRVEFNRENKGGWERNPWMWGVEFRVLSTDGRPKWL